MSNKLIKIKQVTKVTIEENVYAKTIPRILNNRPDVSQETRNRVKKAIKTLGYHPIYIARSLIRGLSFTPGVVSHGIEFFGTSQKLSGIEMQANKPGFSLILYLERDSIKHNAHKVIANMKSRHVERLIWALIEVDKNRDWIREKITTFSIPIIFLTMEQNNNFSVITIDNRKGELLVTKHLISYLWIIHVSIVIESYKFYN